MSTIIAQPGRHAHPHPDPHPDAVARQRRDRLARASVEDMESALAFLGMIDPEAFEIALTAVARRGPTRPARTPDAETPEDEEPLPVCRQCGAPVAIFLDHGLRWQHFRGDARHIRHAGDLRPRPPRRGRLAPSRRGPRRPLASKRPASAPSAPHPDGALSQLPRNFADLMR